MGEKQEDKKKNSKWAMFASIIGGDFIAHDFFRRQANLLILIFIMTIIYIDNRYTSQRELIEIDRLKKELTEAK